MSDPIRSISQNNFLLADQKEVSHDNTLRGNGTEESPLGLNETVLWSGTETVAAVTLSESADNFEYVEIFYRINDGIYNSVKVKPIGAAQRIAFSAGGYYGTGNGLIIKFGTYTLNGSSLGPSQSKIAYIYGGNGSGTASATIGFENNSFYLIRIVGINRIANN